ncbi:MAG: cobalamin-binding protein [Phycisphaerales bacterium]|nr:cobalamin-binding protein [Phycisphaerales bacterium]
MQPPRVVSLLPSATELLFAAGGGDLLVGRSHECDWPAEAMHAPVLTAARVAHVAGDAAGGTPDACAIDAEVREALSTGQSLYTLDEARLAALAPDVILTQDLCDVCSIDRRTVERVARTLPTAPRVINLNPTTVWQVLDDLLTVGAAVGREDAARTAATTLRDRLWTAAEQAVPFTDGPSVLFLEWTDPPFVGGHWTPELIELAGGRHPLNRAGAKSRIATAEEIAASAPERVVVCPCGYPMAAVREAVRALEGREWWEAIGPVRAARADAARGTSSNRVMLVDGNQMFNRPGPRLVDAMEWLSGWLGDRPEAIPGGFPAEPWRPRGATA